MKHDLEICPKCQGAGVSPWAPLFASWPFHARCRNCGTKLRVRVPHWQNALAQILAQAAFWALLLFGLVNGGVAGLLFGGLTGTAVGLLIALIPGFFSKLEPLPE